MTGATLARLAAAVLSTEKGRKTVGWVIAAILSPLILLAAFLCSFGTICGKDVHFVRICLQHINAFAAFMHLN